MSKINNKEIVYKCVQQLLLNRDDANSGLETMEVANSLNMQRTNVSALLNKLVQDKLLIKTHTRPVRYRLAPQKNDDPFSTLIGSHESLKRSIQAVKAAILYPSGSLNLNISANRGAGSTSLVKRIITFAQDQNIISKESVTIINCHNYINDPDSLSDLLFGKQNIFAKGHRCIFLNHLEYLNNQQQARFANLLDHHSLNDVFLIVTSIPETAKNFKTIFPVNIYLPDLKERTLTEKHKLIINFFDQEAKTAGSELVVEINVIKALLLSEYHYNIQELKREIMMACANAHLRIVGTNDHVLHVYLHDLNNQTKFGILNSKSNQHLLEHLYEDQKRITFNASEQSPEPSQLELSKLVDPKIISLIKNWLQTTAQTLQRSFNDNVFYSLCLHVNSLINLHFDSQRISDSKVEELINKYPLEYQAALQLKEVIKSEFSLSLPDSEVMIILLFLIEPIAKKKSENHPVLLYALHGEGAAQALAKTTNTLNPGQKSYYFDLGLTQETNDAYDDLKKLLPKIDQGAGVIVIYDMGSFELMFERLAEETHIKLRLFKMPITLLGIEVAHKAQSETDIDYVYHDISVNLKHLFANNTGKENLIITLCHTGEGGAVQLKNYIEEYSHLNYLVKAMSISNREDLIDEVIQLRQVYNIRAFIGTYNPQLFDVPFISIQKIFSASHKDLDKILTFQPLTTNAPVYDQIYQYFLEEFKFASVAKIKDTLPAIMDGLTTQYDLDRDQKLGLFTHLGSLVERILSGQTIASNDRCQKIIEQFPEDYNYLRKLIKKIERKFNIIVSDDEIAVIIQTVKQNRVGGG